MALTIDLACLAAATLLGFVHIIAASHTAGLQRGYLWSAGPRDEAKGPLSGVAGRLDRASKNYFETFPLFAVAVLTVAVSGSASSLSAAGAALYLIARTLYLPLYAGGVFLIRSLVWNAALLGIVMVLAALWPGVRQLIAALGL